MKGFTQRLALAAALAGSAGAVAAEEAKGRISVELNATQPTEGGCLISFVITNHLSDDINSLVLETVLLDRSGKVDQLKLFDFGMLPIDRPRVRQFALEGKTCDGVGAVLINGAHTCVGSNVTALSCDAALDLSSRLEMDLLG